MAEFKQLTTPVPPSTVAPAPDDKRRAGLTFEVYQGLKSSLHRDLLTKVDLEKVATVRDDPHSRASIVGHPGNGRGSKDADERARERTAGPRGFG